MKAKLFYVIRASKLTPRIYKTENSVLKYLKLHPDLLVKSFKSQMEAEDYLQLINLPDKNFQNTINENINSEVKLENIAEAKKVEVNAILDSENKAKENPKEIDKMNPYYFFQENESLLEIAKQKIIPSEKYHLFFDGASKMNPGPVVLFTFLFNKNFF